VARGRRQASELREGDAKPDGTQRTAAMRRANDLGHKHAFLRTGHGTRRPSGSQRPPRATWETRQPAKLQCTVRRVRFFLRERVRPKFERRTSRVRKPGTAGLFVLNEEVLAVARPVAARLWSRMRSTATCPAKEQKGRVNREVAGSGRGQTSEGKNPKGVAGMKQARQVRKARREEGPEPGDRRTETTLDVLQVGNREARGSQGR